MFSLVDKTEDLILGHSPSDISEVMEHQKITGN